MQSERSFVFTSLAVTFLAASVYSMAYFALLKKQSVYYGNNLRGLFAISTVGEDGIPYFTFRSVPPDDYRPDYRLDHRWVGYFFTPAHWVDRHLRTEYWPKPKSRGSC